jgi:hypothetical protein
MQIAKTKQGQIFKVENGQYYDIQTNAKIQDVNPQDVIEVIKVGFTAWQILKQLYSLIQSLFKK